jgi:hypothetical protein
MRCVISSTVAGWKDARLAGGDGGSGVCGDEVDGGIADRSWRILSEKGMRRIVPLPFDQWMSWMELIWMGCGGV